jgi:hypothetical protein
MKNIIKRILREEFENSEVMSTEHNICDIMTVNSWEEIQSLLDDMEYDDKYSDEIQSIRQQTEKDIKGIAGDADVYNTYLRQIQNIVCR